MITKTCEICGQAFSVKPYRAETARFCSRSCKSAWVYRIHPLPTAHLQGNKFRAGKRPTNAFTSEQVRGKANPRWKQPVTLTCEHCGRVYERKQWRVNQGQTRFWSHACFCASTLFDGERSPLWVGGPKTYRGRNWKRARLAAVERDQGTCQSCGRHIGASIPVHHRRPYREFATPEEANALDNLICLCQPCHMRSEYSRPAQPAAP
jgi:hypothetical protein